MRVVGLLLLLVAATGELFAAEKGPVRLRIVPADALIAPNSTLQYTATFSFIGGANSPAAQRDVTIRVHWFSSDTSVATINAASGVAGSTNKSGTTTITAASGPFTASVPLTVSTATLTAISVAPSPASVPLGLVQQFIATGNYNNSTQHDLTSAAMWDSSVTSVATINTFGLAMSHGQGPTTINAQFGGKTGSATLTVTAPILERVFVTPQNPNLVFPASLQLAATGIYSDASTKDLTSTATWSSAA